MKKHLFYSALFAGAVIVPLHTSLAQTAEKSVAFKTADGKFVTGVPSAGFDLSGTKAGGRQIYNLVDENGGELADGDSVKVMMSDNVKGWKIKDGTLWRGTPAAFKVKKVDNKWAFQARDGKFVGVATGGAVGAVDTLETALQLEIVPATAPAEKKPAVAPATSPAVE
jgi:uncharacterized Zn ribbon protein